MYYMQQYFFLRTVGPIEGFDIPCTEFLDRTVHPPLIGRVGLELDYWPEDDMFHVWPLFFVTERLKAFLTKKFQNLDFQKTISVKGSMAFNGIFPDSALPEYYWRVEFIGIAGVDDFGLYKGFDLVVSANALAFLKDNHVYHIEAVPIEGDVDQFFEAYYAAFKKKYNLK